MADTKISALTDGNPAQSGDEIPIARSGANYKITAGSIASLGGDVDGPASAVDSQIALFDSTTGKLIKAATTTGLLKASSGVIAAAVSSTDYAPATTGTNAQLLANSGSGGFSNVTVGSNLTLSAGTLSATGGLAWQSIQTTGFTAVAGRAYPCNTTSAAFTVTLPASPSAGDLITLVDYAGTWDTNNLTLNPNGLKINGSTFNGVVSTERGAVNLVYVDSTQGWVSYASNLSTAISLPATEIDYLVVGGGAGGGGAGTLGGYGAGGGGAGGYRIGSSQTVSVGSTLTITVGGSGSGGPGTGSGGQGGAGSPSSIVGGSSPSPFATPGIVSNGGGGGGSGSAPYGGANGASGGGGSASGSAGSGNTPAIPGPAVQGYAGGAGALPGPANGGGGGGGSGGVGTAGSSSAGGNGGNGTLGPSFATSYGGSGPGGSPATGWFAGGGGGGANTGPVSSTTGGGGPGSISGSVAGTAGTVNTGGGGGGGAFTNPSGPGSAGGNGGSGTVIIAYADTFRAATTTGSPTYTVSGGYRIYQFTGNGSITF